MFNFEDALKLIPEQTIICVGDLMLDDFVYGEVSRISPEAPAPILAVRRNELTVGGAGNVARNIAALGARCIFLAVVGEDEASRTLMRALAAESLIEPHIVVDARRPTTRKVRFVSEHHATHLLRADWELAEPLDARTEKALIDRTLEHSRLIKENQALRTMAEANGPRPLIGNGPLMNDVRKKIDQVARSSATVLVVPDSAVIDSGSRQVVLIEKGEGRFAPREVKLGARGGGYAEVLEGVSGGERVVTGANFLIDAESNLKAALQGFTAGAPGGGK